MLSEVEHYKKNWQSAQKELRQKDKNCAFVYVHLEADTGNPFYVGIGVNENRPWNFNHHSRTEFHKNIVKKHGCRVEIVINNISLRVAKFWEKAWIKALKEAGYRLANLTAGGDGCCGIPSKNRKSVLCLETGVLYNSAQEASIKNNLSVGTVSQVCNGDYRLVDGPHFMFSDVCLTEDERKLKIIEIELNLAERRKRKNIVKNKNNIVKNGLDRKGRLATGPINSSKKVICVTYGKIFPSASAAADYYDVCKSAVIELCLKQNKRKTVGGLVFEYVKEN